jgi:threonine dehydrogenase-like Zn-dependent dehydrogenase
MNVERVAVLGGRAARLALAEEFGATAVLNYHDAGGSLEQSISGLPGAPFANVIEASGSPAGMHAALGVAAHAGKILMIGDYATARADFPWNHILHGELELIGSNASAGAWPEAVRLADVLPLGRLVSRRLPASSYAEGLELVRNSRDLVKVVLEWSDPARPAGGL